MKRLIITLAAITSVAGYAYGQGQIVFGSTASATTQVSTNNGTVGKIAGGAGAWEFALFKATSTAVTTVGGVSNTISRTDITPWTDAGWAFTGIIASNTATAGRLVVTDPGQGYVTVPSGAAVGSFQNFIIVGWNTAVGGTTLTTLINAYNGGAAGLLYGASGIAAGIQMGDNGATVFNSNVLGALAYETPGWTLAPIPEPASFALAGLGAAAMLIFRRRK